MSHARRRAAALCPAAGMAVLGALLASCSSEHVPRLRFPQVEQATEAMHGGGEVYRDHRTCMESAKSADDLVQCMGVAHWSFVAHGSVFPEPECWEARERAELKRLGPHCFVRGPEHP
jgi:hypothetical protein